VPTHRLRKGTLFGIARQHRPKAAPPGMAGEFYGLFALSGRATAWMAPLFIAIVTAAVHSNRLGVACVLFFLVLGFALLWNVREERADVQGGHP